MESLVQLDYRILLSCILLIISVVYIILSREEDEMVYTKEIDEKGTRVAQLNPQNKIHIREINDTVVDQLLKNVQECPDADFLGSHSSPNEPYSWISYKDFVKDVKVFGSGLQEIFKSQKESKHVGIYGINCYEWILAQFSLVFYSVVPVPLYDTLGSSSIEFVINLTNLETCLCYDEKKIQTLLKNQEKYPQLKNFIVMKISDKDAWETMIKENPNSKFYIYEQVRSLGRENIIDFKKPKIDDTYLINFTSGSTGNPKGVIVTHAMVMKTISSVYLMKEFNQCNEKDPRFIYMRKGDVYFSFLPLAHILEQMMFAISIYSKASIGFYSGHIPSLLDDIKTLSPTLVVFVPRVLSRIYQKALEKVSGSPLKKAIFKSSINLETKLRKAGIKPGSKLIKRVIFGKLNSMLGGRIRIIITGSAPCPPKISKFIRSALDVTFHVGYGASETCGPVTVTYCNDKGDGSVGVPICCSEIQLKDVPHMDIITARDLRGEICIRGPNCTKGYYNNPEQTKELIDDEGWLHTGDVGCWDSKGRLVIVDRCKNLFKLSQGEYISPEKLENAYQLSTIIEQIFIDGDSTKDHIIGLVVPNFEELSKALPSLNTNNPSDLNSDPVKKVILDEMKKIATSQEFNRLEQTTAILILKDAFTLEEGLLTPTLKYVRNKIREKYAKEIQALYSN